MKDPELLPPDLAAYSFVDNEIVLPYDDVLKAIEYLTARKIFVFAWEGWMKHPDGRHGFSREHQGTVEFWGTKERDVQDRLEEASLFAQKTIAQSQREWNEKPEIVGATLYFCLSIEAA